MAYHLLEPPLHYFTVLETRGIDATTSMSRGVLFQPTTIGGSWTFIIKKSHQIAGIAAFEVRFYMNILCPMTMHANLNTREFYI